MIRVAPIFCKAMSKYKRTVVDHSLLGNRVNGNVSLIVAKKLGDHSLPTDRPANLGARFHVRCTLGSKGSSCQVSTSLSAKS